MAELRTVPVSRRTRPAKAPLSREVIVEAGLRILDSEGSGALTMRAVARELDTGAASLYVYVANRDDLMAAMLADVIGAVAEPEEGGWRDRLTALVESTVAAMGRHHGLALVALDATPTAAGTRLADRLRDLLAEGGVDERTRRWAVEMLFLHITATAVRYGADDRREETDDGEEAERIRWSLRALVDGILATPAG